MADWALASWADEAIVSSLSCVETLSVRKQQSWVELESRLECVSGSFLFCFGFRGVWGFRGMVS